MLGADTFRECQHNFVHKQLVQVWSCERGRKEAGKSTRMTYVLNLAHVHYEMIEKICTTNNYRLILGVEIDTYTTMINGTFWCTKYIDVLWVSFKFTGAY